MGSQGAGTFWATRSRVCAGGGGERNGERRGLRAELAGAGDGSRVLSSSSLGARLRVGDAPSTHDARKQRDGQTDGPTEEPSDVLPAVSVVLSQHTLGPGTASAEFLPCAVLRPQRTVHFVLLLMLTSFS